MNYYIAKDRFGNYDLAHYGVKGMKWGETNEDPRLGGTNRWAQIGNSATNKAQANSSSPSSQPSSSSKGIWASGRGGSAAKTDQKTTAPNVNRSLVEAAVKAESAQDSSSDEDDTKIAEANVNYQAALMDMQLLARISLGNGLSPAANPEYLAARKKAIDAKYELDKLNLAKQEKAAKNPPTMAEQRQAADSDAKKQLAEDKSKPRKSGIPEVDVEYTRQDKTAQRAADVNRGANRTKPTRKKR